MRGRVERPPALTRRVKVRLRRVFGRNGAGSILTYVTKHIPTKAEHKPCFHAPPAETYYFPTRSSSAVPLGRGRVRWGAVPSFLFVSASKTSWSEGILR